MSISIPVFYKSDSEDGTLCRSQCPTAAVTAVAAIAAIAAVAAVAAVTAVAAFAAVIAAAVAAATTIAATAAMVDCYVFVTPSLDFYDAGRRRRHP